MTKCNEKFSKQFSLQLYLNLNKPYMKSNIARFKNINADYSVPQKNVATQESETSDCYMNALRR